MEVKRSFVFITLFVLISVPSSDGIKCWFCSSTGSEKNKCGEHFDKTGIETMECGDVSCIKKKMTYVKPAPGFDKIVYIRSCATRKEKDGCSTTEHPGKYTEDICYCNKDVCNSAIIPKVSLVAISFGLFLKMIFRC